MISEMSNKMYWKDKDGNNYKLPSHCINNSIGDYYYLSNENTAHQIEKMLNPLVCYAGMAGMSAFIEKDFLWNLQNKKDTI